MVEFGKSYDLICFLRCISKNEDKDLCKNYCKVEVYVGRGSRAKTGEGVKADEGF